MSVPVQGVKSVTAPEAGFGGAYNAELESNLPRGSGQPSFNLNRNTHGKASGGLHDTMGLFVCPVLAVLGAEASKAMQSEM
jgi:hypothetical protein